MSLENIFIAIFLFLGLICSILLGCINLYRNRLLSDFIKDFINLNKITYTSSLDILTINFIINYYSELLAKKFYFHNFSISTLLNNNPHNILEIVLSLFYAGSLVFFIRYRSNKIFSYVTNFMKSPKYGEQISIYITKMFFITLWIIFDIIIVVPIFSYGLNGNFGNINF